MSQCSDTENNLIHLKIKNDDDAPETRLLHPSPKTLLPTPPLKSPAAPPWDVSAPAASPRNAATPLALIESGAKSFVSLCMTA